MSLASGRSFKTELQYALKAANLPLGPEPIIGRMFRFGCEHGSHHHVLVGTVSAIEASDEGGLELYVSCPSMWGRKIDSIAYTASGWAVRLQKSASHGQPDRLLEWHEEHHNPPNEFPGELELL